MIARMEGSHWYCDTCEQRVTEPVQKPALLESLGGSGREQARGQPVPTCPNDDGRGPPQNLIKLGPEHA
jgi:hypothetical protein